jgi:hypothetical protein
MGEYRNKDWGFASRMKGNERFSGGPKGGEVRWQNRFAPGVTPLRCVLPGQVPREGSSGGAACGRLAA